MEHFDWQTEDEGPVAPTDAIATVGSGQVLAVLAIIALLAFAGLILWQLGSRLQQQEKVVREDVMAAFGIWQDAMVRQDGDLLDTLLLDGEATWTATQRELLASARSLDRSGIGLTLAQGSSEALDSGAEIKLSDDWRTAEVTFPMTYLRQAQSTRYTEVTLEHTVLLVRDGSRWLLRRPGEEFWGDWRSRSGDLVEISYRERDQAFAEGLLKDLEQALAQVCQATSEQGACLVDRAVHVRLESDAATLLKEIDQETPEFAGRTIVLPSPTWVGRPLDAAGYDALFEGFSAPIVKTFAASLAAPVKLPEQIVALLCFGRSGRVPRLFFYDPLPDKWSLDHSGSAFRFLTASDDDSNIVMRQHIPREPTRLRLVHWSDGRGQAIHDEVYGPLSDHSLGWVNGPGQRGLLLAQYQGTERRPSYRFLQTDASSSAACSANSCPSRAFYGFPTWSPDGRHSMLLTDEGLYLADGLGNGRDYLGEGHHPFWLDDRLFGFVRTLAGERGLTQELVLGAIDEPGLRVLWSTAMLAPELYGAKSDEPFFIQYVAATGKDPRRLLLYGRQYAGQDSRYAVLSLLLAKDDSDGDRVALPTAVRLELAVDRMPAGIPSAADPNGHVPFVLSPDGQWLTIAYLAESGTSQWVILTTKIGQPGRLESKARYPGYSFNHPFFDWSLDGHWLLIVEETFIKLAAPNEGYERLIPHENGACSYPAWINRGLISD